MTFTVAPAPWWKWAMAAAAILGAVVSLLVGSAVVAVVSAVIIAGAIWWWLACVRLHIAVGGGRVEVRGPFHRTVLRVADIAGVDVVPVADGNERLWKWPVMKGAPKPGDLRLDVGGTVGVRMAARTGGVVLVVFRDHDDARRCAAAIRGAG
ncbi:hypothetical protein ACFWGD_05225 [Corynebacterium sp. NPDC060344]|uniref:hypothetical protein n=1 Tax=Corynebacterium sp. NPDC060344 TaxID=3347101 RepID=UPI00364835D9